MTNPNKIIVNGNTLIDVTGDTVTAATLLSGYTAHDASGTAILGTASGGTPTLQTKSETYTPTETAQTDAIAADNGYDGLDTVNITVSAISSTYVGSGITQRTSSDLSASGATVTAPAGYYASSASTSVSSGTAGTPTATKGTVSGHAISVTPSVTNTAGYISGGTINGTAVSVSASELVSGTYTVDSSGTKDVTNYASASVPSGSVTAPSTISGSSASVSTGTNTLTLSKTISVTPSVTAAGYVSSGTAGNSSVSLSASVPTQASQTLYPSTSDQTIASGTYLTGAQTLKAVTTTNLTADNIKSGVTVQVGDSSDSDRVASVTGTYSGGGGTSIVPIIIRGDAEKVQTWSYDKLIYADENVTIPAYTTSATTMKSGAALTPTVSLDYSSYSYLIMYRYLAMPVYSNSTNSAGRQNYWSYSQVYTDVYTPLSLFVNSGTTTTANQASQVHTLVGSVALQRQFYCTSSTNARIVSNTYGAYMATVAPTITMGSSSPYSTGTLQVSSPTLYLRGQTAYLNQTNWEQMTDIRYQYVIELWRVPTSSSVVGWEVESQFRHILECANGTGTLT